MPAQQWPIVQPRYRELPPLNWVKAFLRTYASSDETQVLREVQATLPRELVEARQHAASHHRCIILGASGVGKSTLVATFCEGPPKEQGGGGASALGLDGLARSGLSASGDEAVAAMLRGLSAGGQARSRPYWPTVGTKCSHGTVNTPGLPPLRMRQSRLPSHSGGSPGNACITTVRPTTWHTLAASRPSSLGCSSTCGAATGSSSGKTSFLVRGACGTALAPPRMASGPPSSLPSSAPACTLVV